MELTMLIENLVYKQYLKAEHGLSFLIETEGKKIIFDTGQTNKFINNAVELGEDLRDIDYIVISHGHYDHTGGLERLLEINHSAKVIIKKQSFEEKFSNSTGEMREIGMTLEKPCSEYDNEFIFAEENFHITDNVKIVSKIGKYTDFENDEKKLFVKENGNYIDDPFEDELFLVIENGEKIDIITGCAHRGIINIVNTAEILYPKKKIGSIIGGFHLKGKTVERVNKTIEELNTRKIDKIYVNHCSGIDFYCKLKECLDAEYLHTGKKI